jgi:hypothetical protein
VDNETILIRCWSAAAVEPCCELYCGSRKYGAGLELLFEEKGLGGPAGPSVLGRESRFGAV